MKDSIINTSRIAYTCTVLLLFYILIASCSSDTNSDTTDLGSTTPSDIPFGDYPDIPRPSSVGDTQRSESERDVEIKALATDFRPPVTGILGKWNIRREAWRILNQGYCVTEVVNGVVHSDEIRHRAVQVNCAYPFVWLWVYYPNRTDRTRRYLEGLVKNELNGNGSAHRPILVSEGNIINVPKFSFTFSHNVLGDQVQTLTREACERDGYGGISPLPCRYDDWSFCSVEQRKLTNPVFLKKEVFWQREGAFEYYVNDEESEFTRMFSRTFKSGYTKKQGESFAITTKKSLEVGAEYEGVSIKGGIEETLTNTFSTEITVSEEETITQSWTVSIAGKSEVIFEVWNLIEQYSFVLEDGSPYTDPNYTFDELGILESRATVGTAMVSTSF
ncbi:hypothetical protein PP178_12490 [Zeaxanthinibacter sp. PT1]|uniref:hypothetical protein n=1 Tax=Zeaxanthinibacter TaxID=561554 RepID=UPI002349753C|nr:hypothetical protein [Zeaxanthinibacter sp. PT1]MDC6352373.1 hypothetical protein [Zeaxanthinibacter sp. PT1]